MLKPTGLGFVIFLIVNLRVRGRGQALVERDRDGFVILAHVVLHLTFGQTSLQTVDVRGDESLKIFGAGRSSVSEAYMFS